MDMPDLFEADDDDDEQEATAFDPYEEVMLELIDEITLGLCFEIHRSCKLGTYFLDETDSNADEQFALVNEQGLDVFGQVPMKKQVECICPNCHRNIAASRFAPHLEKCMGMGRNSSRIASRRIANANANAKKDSDNESEQDDDNDWSYAADRKIKKLKKDKNNHSSSPRRGKNKHRNGASGDGIPSVGSTKSDDSGNHLPIYDTMSLDDKKALLASTCGVISEHTKKMCTRSGRCPQHTDEQRRSVRTYLLTTEHDPADQVVDIDTYDADQALDSQALRDSLQWETAASPADSTSTSSSIVSKKRKHGKTSKKKSKSASGGGGSGSRGGTPTGSVLLGYLVSNMAAISSSSCELPPAPVCPAPTECCGNGCSPCVMDIYDQEVRLWQEECDRITNGTIAMATEDSTQDPILLPDRYTEFSIIEIRDESRDTKCYRFSVSSGRRLPLAVGQHLIMRWRNSEAVVTRQYTPVLCGKGFFDVVIKVYDDGVMSAYVRDWQVGDRIEWRGPCGDFFYKANEHAHVIMLAAGSGIAPMIPIIRHIVTNDNDDTIIRLLYACRSYSDILCKQMLDEFSGYWNFSVCYYVSQQCDGEAVKYGDKVIAGRLTEERFKQQMETRASHTTTKILVCGTRAFDKDMINYVTRWGAKKQDIHKF